MKRGKKAKKTVQKAEKTAEKGWKTDRFATHGARDKQKKTLPKEKGGPFVLRAHYRHEGRPLLAMVAVFPHALEIVADEESGTGPAHLTAKEEKATGASSGAKAEKRAARARVREAGARESINAFYRALAAAHRAAVEDILLPTLREAADRARAEGRRVPHFRLIGDAHVAQNGDYFTAVREVRLFRDNTLLFSQNEEEVFSLINGHLLSPAALRGKLVGAVPQRIS